MIRNKSSIKELAESIGLEYQEKITPLDRTLEDEELSVYYDSGGKNTFDGITFYDNEKFYIHINTDLGNRPQFCKREIYIGTRAWALLYRFP